MVAHRVFAFWIPILPGCIFAFRLPREETWQLPDASRSKHAVSGRLARRLGRDPCVCRGSTDHPLRSSTPGAGTTRCPGTRSATSSSRTGPWCQHLRPPVASRRACRLVEQDRAAGGSRRTVCRRAVGDLRRLAHSSMSSEWIGAYVTRSWSAREARPGLAHPLPAKLAAPATNPIAAPPSAAVTLPPSGARMAAITQVSSHRAVRRECAAHDPAGGSTSPSADRPRHDRPVPRPYTAGGRLAAVVATSPRSHAEAAGWIRSHFRSSSRRRARGRPVKLCANSTGSGSDRADMCNRLASTSPFAERERRRVVHVVPPSNSRSRAARTPGNDAAIAVADLCLNVCYPFTAQVNRARRRSRRQCRRCRCVGRRQPCRVVPAAGPRSTYRERPRHELAQRQQPGHDQHDPHRVIERPVGRVSAASWPASVVAWRYWANRSSVPGAVCADIGRQQSICAVDHRIHWRSLQLGRDRGQVLADRYQRLPEVATACGNGTLGL